MQEIQAIKRSTERNQSSLHNLINGTGSLASQEAEWIHMGPDLAALGAYFPYGPYCSLRIVVFPLTGCLLKKKTQRLIAQGLPESGTTDWSHR